MNGLTERELIEKLVEIQADLGYVREKVENLYTSKQVAIDAQYRVAHIEQNMALVNTLAVPLIIMVVGLFVNMAVSYVKGKKHE